MRHKILRLVSATIIFWNITPLSSLCAHFKEFTPPTSVIVKVFKLFSSGASSGEKTGISRMSGRRKCGRVEVQSRDWQNMVADLI